ncbi:hypothetical protein ACFO4E_15895 [Nocardiopsis mangrovi]|uniref:Antitoxin n=1 Tax=Nocardiopsis mangrovi TaxID=1179818 RepID=A0ABV9DZ14_9ACTN
MDVETFTEPEELSMARARDRLSQLVDRVATGREIIYITRGEGPGARCGDRAGRNGGGL